MLRARRFRHSSPSACFTAAWLQRTRARVAGAAVALLVLPLSPVFAAEHPADRSLAESARASIAAAATQMVDGTHNVAMFALSLVGIDYRFGGDTPDAGLDCSGLIRYVFQEVTGVALPRTSRELGRIGKSVRLRDLAPGDLVFFNTRHFPNSHVGIYLGDDRFIHAPSKGGEVGVAMLSAQYWRERYNGARRLVGVLPGLVPPLVPQARANPPDVATSAPPAASVATAQPVTAAISQPPSSDASLDTPQP